MGGRHGDEAEQGGEQRGVDEQPHALHLAAQDQHLLRVRIKARARVRVRVGVRARVRVRVRVRVTVRVQG